MLQRAALRSVRTPRGGASLGALLARGSAAGTRQHTTPTDPLTSHLQRSRVPTYHYQPSLPRLPVPDLDKTLDKYLGVVAPLVDAAQLDRTRGIVDDFRRTDGPLLHNALLARDKANKGTSYISEWWYEKYLADRTPLPINVNPFLVLVDPEDPAMRSQVDRASRMIFSAARFTNSLRDEVLAPDVFHLKPAKTDTPWFDSVARLLPGFLSWYWAAAMSAFPLSMVQYAALLGSTRIPKRGSDEIRTVAGTRHVVVMRGGRFYSVDALGADGTPTPLPQLRAEIEAILADQRPALPMEASIGVLTSENRDKWADARAALEASSAANKAALDAVDSALFALCLDDTASEDPVAVARQFLHSDGSNRWFDKSFSLLIDAKGVTSINFEHAWGDGVAVLRFITDCYTDSVRPIGQDLPAYDGPKIEPREIAFDPPAEVRAAATAAGKRLADHASKLSIELRKFEGYGKEWLKERKVSPDGVAQLSLQLAYARMFGKTVSTYESASTAAYRHGRTECVRSATLETKAFCDRLIEVTKAGGDWAPHKAELLGLVKAAMDKHNAWIKDGAMGNGVDRHLFGLQKMAEADADIDPPAIFSDKAYSTMKTDYMSTSTLGVSILQGGGFGPTVEHGFGIGYNVADNDIGFVVTSNGGAQDVVRFVDEAERALIDIGKILEA
jgi:carnitine O-palmitoyltransferase 2